MGREEVMGGLVEEKEFNVKCFQVFYSKKINYEKNNVNHVYISLQMNKRATKQKEKESKYQCLFNWD